MILRRLAMLAAFAPAGAKTPYYMYAPTPKPTPKPTLGFGLGT